VDVTATAPQAKATAQYWRTTMFRKFALGLVAAASISAAAFTPTAASAHGFGGGFGGGWGHHWGFHRFGYGFGGPVVDSCVVVTPYGRVINTCY
jgi:hypothetical protein